MQNRLDFARTRVYYEGEEKESQQLRNFKNNGTKFHVGK